jgi:tetratricopeptide (TPR) repeat protein
MGQLVREQLGRRASSPTSGHGRPLDLLSRLSSLTVELKRRRVFRVALIYAAVGWVVVEVTATVFPILFIPDWAVRLVVLAVLLGFPVALGLAWAFDVTPEGIRRAEPVGDTPPAVGTGQPAAESPVGGAIAPVEQPTAAAAAAPRWRGLLALALILAALGTGAWWSLARRAAAPDVSTNLVAILPFDYRGTPAFAYLADGMVDLLSRKLNGAGELRTVHPQALLGQLSAAPERERLTVDAARRVAARLGAGLFVLGSATEAGGQIQLSASLFDANGSELGSAETTGAEPNLFSLVDDLARELLGRRWSGPAGRLIGLASETTESLPALKSYLEGERLLRVGALDGAVEAISRAVAEDSTFALAHYRLGVANSFRGQIPPAWASIRQALRHAGRLSADDRLLLEAVVAYTRNDATTAELLYRQVLQRQPENVEALYQLGELLFHFNPSRGRSPVEARVPFERAVALDPGHMFSVVHLIHLGLMERRVGSLDSILSRVIQVDTTGDFERTAPLLHAAISDNAEDRARALDSHRDDPVSLRRVSFDIAIAARNLEFAEQVVRTALAAEPNPAANAGSYRTLSEIEVARGRWQEAKQAAAEFERIVGTRGLAAGYMMWPFVPATADDLRNAREALVAELATARSRQNREAEIDFHTGIALIDLRLGDPANAQAMLDELERLLAERAAAAAEPSRMLSPLHAADLLRAVLAMERGDPAGALAILEASGWDVKELEVRYIYARALEAVGRDADALRWYDTFDNEYLVGTWHLPPLAPSHLHRAELYERGGNTERAVFHYRRFIELWQDADPELQPLVDGARQRLAQLSSESAARP